MKKLPGPLFRGMHESDIDAALTALHARERTYEKDALIYMAGDPINSLGLVLEGSVTVESNDVWGSRTILSHVSAGHVFAETYAMVPDQPLLVDVTANEACRILFLEVGSLLSQLDGTKETQPWMATLTRNLLAVFAQKNLHLASRNFHTAPHSVRGRVLSYLNSVALQSGSDDFTIPYDRQQLADYLNLDRSALSKELGKMKRDGLIDFRKNHFHLYGNE